MSKTGRAVVYDAPNAPFQVREYPVRDVHPGEVLVRITMSTICRSDIHSYQGHRPNPESPRDHTCGVTRRTLLRPRSSVEW